MVERISLRIPGFGWLRCFDTRRVNLIDGELAGRLEGHGRFNLQGDADLQMQYRGRGVACKYIPHGPHGFFLSL